MPPIPRLVRALFIVLGGLAFLPLLALGAVTLIGHDIPGRVLPIALFSATTSAAFIWFWARAKSPLERAVCILAVTGSALAISANADVLRGAYLIWIYPAALIGFALRPARAALSMIGLGAIIVLLVIVEVAPQGAGHIWKAVGGIGVPALVGLALAGWASITVAQLLLNNADLHVAREELARLAVEEERARFARDLHDLLGHTLSLVVVKLELATRLLPGNDHPAAIELREVEQLARGALKDVREVASGYRQPTLAAELAGARVALEAAGMALHLDKDIGVLSPDIEATCAWTVREGVTNVVRHSGARECTVRIHTDRGRVVVDVSDDGRGPDSSTPGMGLTGLRERVQRLGGSVEWGAAATRGFQLTAVIPVTTP